MSLKEKLGKIGKIVSMPTIGKDSYGYEKVLDYLRNDDRLKIDYVDHNVEKKLEIGAQYVYGKISDDDDRLRIATGKHELYTLKRRENTKN